MHWASVIAKAPLFSRKNSRYLLVSSFTFQNILIKDGSLPSNEATLSSSILTDVSASIPRSKPNPAVEVSSAILINSCR